MATSRSNRGQVRGWTAGMMLAGALLVGPVMAAAADPATTPAQWHTQKLEFTYSGFTAFYTCDGLEGKVRDILLTFGARKDVKVRALGCDRAHDAPNKMAWVEVEFSALAPAADASTSGTVQGVWTKVQLAPHQPTNMGMGECELVEQMRPMLEKGFALRNTDYRTTCVPKQMSSADYNVKAEVLQLKPIAY